MPLFLLISLRVQNQTVDPSSILNQIDVDGIREDIQRRRAEFTQKIAAAERGEEFTVASVSRPASHLPTVQSKADQSPYRITWFAPQSISAEGGQSVLLNLEPPLKSSAFCKFNTEILNGWLTLNRSVACPAPPLRGGDVYLSISDDRVSWSKPVILSVVEEGSDYLLFVVAVALIAGAYLVKRLLFPKKKRDEDDVDQEGSIPVVGRMRDDVKYRGSALDV
jgi:hypothetical protein